MRLDLREHECGLSRRAAVAILAAPAAGGTLVAAGAADDSLYRTLVREDALLEWLQVLLWVAAFVFAVVLVGRTSGRERVAWAVFALGALAALGEELAWGQRIVGFSTPDALADGDKQDEAAIHNVRELEAPTRLAVAAVAAAGCAAAWTTVRVPRCLTGAFALVAGYEVLRVAAGESPPYWFAKWSEWPETCFAGALAAVAGLTFRR